MLRPTICMRGEEAAALFYDERCFVRRGAVPLRVQGSLFGKDGVQSLDAEAHRHRKSIFIAVNSPERIAALAETARVVWRAHLDRWCCRDRIVLYDELQPLLTRAVCQWAGVPLNDAELPLRAREITARFDAAGAVGLRHWHARLSHARADRWILGLIEGIRADRIRVAEESIAGMIANFRNPDGSLLPPQVAAAELLNVLRPTVAVAVYIVFVAHALHRFPGSREALLPGDEGAANRFLHEVRRLYPFFPAATARVREDFEWQGMRFPKGRRVMLDLHGTNRDERTWDNPEVFEPERFREARLTEFNFIPQGGGDPKRHHRCPGEGITAVLMMVALRFLTQGMTYEVPNQDLSLDWQRLPALPRSRMVLQQIRAT